MAINLINNPVGIDKEIQRIEERLYNGLNYSNIEAYGRCYVIDVEDKTVPVYYSGEKEYKEVLLNDALAMSFFFIERPTSTKANGHYTTPIDIIFMMNLESLKPEINHRADEELKAEIDKILVKNTQFTLTEVKKGLDALEGFDHELKDMQPYSFLKFTGEIKYQINC
tara:strand:- start:730 stop:1233 length:504 start_codon:yes stop_codon:yes gene_type:complete